MLSFDITDRNVRVVKGVENSGKIKISSAATLNLEEGLIVNGKVEDVANVATLINGVIKTNKMPDKEAIVSISSNLTIFKELNVTKSKNQDMAKTVKQQVQAELNLDDSYCVTYVIVGEAEEKSDTGESVFKVLATACPYAIVNSYKEVFKFLDISLRSVMIGCNCITKVLLADTKIKSKMPLLAVQVDNNFISLNLYEQGQLSFSRFASIDPEDYGGAEDYVIQAVNENVFRMNQFQRSRNTGEIIENIILYGDTHDYVRLTDELEQQDFQTSLINVPPQIHGHENLEFSLYANAIGAMFKRDKETEKINLLETELGAHIKSKVGGAASESAGTGIMLGTIVVAAVIVGVAWGVQAARDASIRKKIDDINDFIAQSQPELDHYDKLVTMEEKVNAYNTMIVNAHDAYLSHPIILGDVYDTIEAVLDYTSGELGISEASIISPSYSDGIMSFTVTYEGKDENIQLLPADFIEDLISKDVAENNGYFANATYSGYTVNTATISAGEGTPEREVETVTFSVDVAMVPNVSAYHPDEKADGEGAEDGGEAGADTGADADAGADAESAE